MEEDRGGAIRTASPSRTGSPLLSTADGGDTRIRQANGFIRVSPPSAVLDGTDKPVCLSYPFSKGESIRLFLNSLYSLQDDESLTI